MQKFELQSQTGKPIDVVISEIEEEIYEHGHYLHLSALTTPLRMLILSCYEVVKDEYDSNDTEWQFFRHVRNAAAHNGKFDIRSTPQHPVKWSSKEITAVMHGTPLFHDTDRTQSFLLPGDILRLLRDIEARVQPLPTQAWNSVDARGLGAAGSTPRRPGPLDPPNLAAPDVRAVR
ncbi:hypothetical protein AQJ91_25595 [Streptomyces dysideae]|uniref:Uncharacterized protein n=1 Tax=Streptomyces dysideae TaxID=909626 RepID=A0A117S0E2_9ACTN|nr:hypothetical protein AQJ91_25595 [Streptomyces dysideae]